MKKINIIILILVSIIGISSCSVKIGDQEIDDLMFGYGRGLIVGVAIGDSWESVKENARPGWDIREESNIYQFRKDWDPGNDMLLVTFQLNESNIIIGMELSMTAMPNNYDKLDELRRKTRSDLNLITASRNMSRWEHYSFDGEKYDVVLSEPVIYSERKSFYVNVKKVK